jgi:hypothetical protein
MVESLKYAIVIKQTYLRWQKYITKLKAAHVRMPKYEVGLDFILPTNLTHPTCKNLRVLGEQYEHKTIWMVQGLTVVMLEKTSDKYPNFHPFLHNICYENQKMH